jgi:biopolymer transport protein TolR
MGMSTGGGKPGSVQSEINVTPLIDVLLVLLIIFLVVMPIMMKKETLTVPRKIDNEVEQPSPDAVMLTITVHKDLQVIYNDGTADQPPIQLIDIAKNLRPKLEQVAKSGQERVVFVDFDPEVSWRTTVETRDTIRSLADDVNHDVIKVALKVKEDNKPAQ